MDEMKMDLEQIKEPGEDFDYMFLSEDEYNDLVLRIQEEIDKLKLENTEEGTGDIMQLNIFLHGLRDLMSKARILDERYSDMVANGSYYTYYFKNPKETKEGEICLILDGKPTDHIIPHETLEELNEDIEQYIYDGNGEKYTPLAAIVGNRPFLPVAWYIKICVGVEPEKKQLQELKSKATKSWVTTLDRVSQMLNNDEIEYGKKVGIRTGRKGEDKYYTVITLDLNDRIVENAIDGKLNGFDMAVLSAVCSCYDSGNTLITTGVINNALSGKKNATLHDKQKKEIAESMQKLMDQKITMDVTAEAASYGFEGDNYVRNTRMLVGYTDIATNKGKTVEVYVITAQPLLLWYAQHKKQYSTLPIELRAVPLSCTRETVTLCNYLLNRIQVMKRSAQVSNIIKYDSAIDYVLGGKKDEMNEYALQKRRVEIIAKIGKILDYWKDKGFILGWKEGKVGKRRDRVEIFWKPEQLALASKK